MEGSEKVKVLLQAAINAEAQLYGIYKLYYLDAKRFGLGIAEGWHKIHQQSEDFQDQLICRLLFLEGDPELAPVTTTTEEDVLSALHKAQEAETAIVAQYAAATKACWDEGDISNFHFFQHLSKWHREGDDKYVGHLKWIQRQLWAISQVELSDYIAAKIGEE